MRHSGPGRPWGKLHDRSPDLAQHKQRSWSPPIPEEPDLTLNCDHASGHFEEDITCIVAVADMQVEGGPPGMNLNPSL